MSTATLEQDRLVSQPARDILYAARREELRLVHTAQYPKFGPQGQKTGINTPGITFTFVGGNFRVPLEGEVETENGTKVDAAMVNEWLQNHKLFGDMWEGFIKVEQAKPPITADEIKAITRAQMALRADVLEAIIEQEREGWNRAELIEAAQDALEGLETLKAEAEALRVDVEAEAGQQPAKPPKPTKP